MVGTHSRLQHCDESTQAWPSTPQPPTPGVLGLAHRPAVAPLAMLQTPAQQSPLR